MSDTAPSQSVVFQYMREAVHGFRTEDKNISCATFMQQTYQKCLDASVVPNTFRTFRDLGLYHHIKIRFFECYHHLLTAGYIIPFSENMSAFSFFVITERGKKWAEGSDPVPEDIEGYQAHIKKEVPSIDPIVEQYILEALLAYNRGAFFAAAVMVGAASEKVVYLLTESIRSAAQEPMIEKKLSEALDRRSLFTMLNLVGSTVDRLVAAKIIPYQVHEGAGNHLISLQEAIRVQRNEAVHPVAGRVSAESVKLSLSAFPVAYKKSQDLISWFSTNQFK
jgi:hypothetical protein